MEYPTFKNKSLLNDSHEDESASLETDQVIIYTVIGVAILLVVALSIGTWHCVRRAKSGQRRTQRFQRFSSQRQCLSRQSTMSQEHFKRLLDLYHRTGSEQDSTFVKEKDQTKGLVKGAKTPPQEQVLLKKMCPRRSPEGFPPPERLRQGSPHPVTIMTNTLLDLDSPESLYAGPTKYEKQWPRKGRFSNLRSPRYRADRSSYRQPGTPRRPPALASPDPAEGRPSLDPAGGASSPSSADLSLEPAETTDQKPFYFAWPEEEEENQGEVWSPLCLKAAMDTTKEAINVSVDTPKKAENGVVKVVPVDPSSRTDGPVVDTLLDSPVRLGRGVVSSKAGAVPGALKSTWV